MLSIGATLKGISWLMPEEIETNDDLVRQFGTWTAKKIYSKTGINKRHIAKTGLVSDYATEVAEKFFHENPSITKDSIDVLVLCTETPDYVIPSTSCIVHDRLNLPKTCGAFDYNLGCSGYVYGLAICKGFIASGIAKRTLLITGDVMTRFIHPNDKSTRTIFSDGFSATLLEASPKDSIGAFCLGTDGKGYSRLIIEAGASAMPISPSTKELYTNKYGNSRTKENLYMDGPSVLEFALREVPPAVGSTLQKANLQMQDIDLFVFHQASVLLLENLRELLQIPPEKFIISMEDKGNTISSSIPIALHESLANGKLRPGMKVMVCGFGVGLSWGCALIDWQ